MKEQYAQQSELKSKRYDNPEYRSNRNKSIKAVQISGTHCLCFLCLRPTPIRMYRTLSTGVRKPNKRWMELHYLGYRQNFRSVSACTSCHQGPGWDKSKSVLHHPAHWICDYEYPERSRNTRLATISFTLQWWVGCAIAGLFRAIFNREGK